MKVATRLNGLAIAAAAAALFAVAPIASSAAEGGKTGHCMGANGCKGQSACKTASNECKGHNACKGKGYVESTKEVCDKQGGKFKEAKAEEPMKKDKPKVGG